MRPEQTCENMRPIDRYKHPLLGISLIAEQAYCEQMVDLWLQNPSRLTSVPAIYEERIEEFPEAKRQVALAGGGTQFHESVSSTAVPASWNEIKEMLRSGRSLTMLESRLQGSYDSLALVGRPDAVCFDGWKARCILEYKVTESARLYLSHRVQLQPRMCSATLYPRISFDLIFRHNPIADSVGLLVCCHTRSHFS